MDSNLLKIFVAVAQESSVTLGAKKLGYAQSNVTSRIKQLEKTFECSLFHRVPKGVILTPEGKRLYPYALDVVEKIDVTMKNMKNIRIQESVCIGTTEANAAIRIVPLLENLYVDFPFINFKLIINTTKETLDLLLNYEIDFAFVNGIPNEDEIMVIKQFDEEMVLVEGHNKLSDGTFLVFKEGCAFNTFTHNYLNIKYPNKSYRFLEFGTYETILGCVKAGIGKSILPITVVKRFASLDELKITPLDKEYSNLPACLVCRKDFVPKIISQLKRLKL